MKKGRVFNLVVVGCGGQGVLSLAEIVSQAAFYQGYEVREAELHGLAQRGGALECHVRFGKKIYSPLIRQASADLIIGLELLETLRAYHYMAKNKTIVLTNAEFFSPQPFRQEEGSLQPILQKIKKTAKSFKIIDADKVLKRERYDTAVINTFMLGYAVTKNFLPIKKKFIFQALTGKIRPIFLEQNKKIFEMAEKM